MGNFTFGFKVLFRIWRDAEFAQQVQQLEQGKLVPEVTGAGRAEAPVERAPRRSDAITLLSVLQREARWVDFIKESIADYSDAQVGAAVRDIHKSCAAALERMFEIRPLLDSPEGSPVEVPRGFDPAQFRLTGQVTNEPPHKGRLCHHGWKASKCELPEWTGNESSALIVAPAEVEIR